MFGKIHIGLRMLFHNKGRLALSLAGIAFAVTIMFMQMGFFNGINDSQANIARLINADLVVLDSRRTHLNKWTRFDPVRITQILSVPGVAKVMPVYKDGAGLENPQTKQVKRTIVYAFPPRERPFNLSGLTREAENALSVYGTALYDSKSREIFGSFNIGDTLEIDEQNYRLVGEVQFGPNLVNDGTVLISDGTWLGKGGDSRPIMAFVRVIPEARTGPAIAAIKAGLPSGLIGLTPQELAEREILYTIVNAPVGTIFAIGLAVSLIIGTVICYQILFNDVTDNIPQYATLKAMGFGPGFLIFIVLEEAFFLACLGFLPGLAMSYLLYQEIGDLTRLVMFLNPERIGLIFGLTFIMCIAAGLLAIRKVLKLDPAALYA